MIGAWKGLSWIFSALVAAGIVWVTVRFTWPFALAYAKAHRDAQLLALVAAAVLYCVAGCAVPAWVYRKLVALVGGR
jgi:hypothetical protein